MTIAALRALLDAEQPGIPRHPAPRLHRRRRPRPPQEQPVIVIRGLTADDVAEVIESLITAADAVDSRAPGLAAQRRHLANQIGDALDQLPAPRTPDQE